ncbi:thioredoxin family protein [Lacihabitans lacunae]|jgi:thioredoxin 1|uniref:Thioredoxin family protein n=1 Tax=Lacihabitans lacunae TaxID=1028214 RepID=A0ABV7YXT8_9BACT
MKKFTSLFIIGFAALCLSSFVIGPQTSAVKFYSGTYDNFLREAKKQNKPIILDFWASWCGPCQKLENETFSNKETADYINKNFMVFKVDIDTFDGMEIVDRFAIDVFPTLMVLDSKSNPKDRLKGFYSATYMEKELEKIIQKHGIKNASESNFVVRR